MIYVGYAIFRKHKGIIGERQEPFRGYHGSLASCGDKMFILLNKDDSQNQKIKTIVHELLHIGYEYGTKEWNIVPGFPLPYKITKKEAIEIVEKLERLIEEETEKVLQCQPVLISHFKRIVIQNKENQSLFDNN